MATALVSWVMVYTPGQLYVGFLLFSHNYFFNSRAASLASAITHFI